MFKLTAVVAVICSLFASIPWPATFFVLFVANGIAYFVLVAYGKRQTAGLAALTSILTFATLLFTDLGFESLHHTVVVAWLPLIAACISQLAYDSGLVSLRQSPPTAKK